MKSIWTLQDAKNKFSQVVKEALTDGPQYVTRRGIEAVVVVSVQEYETLTSSKPSFTDFLLHCPTLDDELPVERLKDLPKELDL